MAKKTRIDRRGKIRSIVTRWNFTNNLPHWSITKRAAVWERRRVIDDLWLTETITLSDVVLREQERLVSSGSTVGDAVNINDEKVILNSATFADTGGIAKDFQSPIKIDYKHDPGLIGGLVIQVGSVMVDTSIKTKLRQLQKSMIEA